MTTGWQNRRTYATSPQYSSMAEFMLKRLDSSGEECKICNVHKVYDDLEVCLGDNDRSWSKCQVELQTFKLCYDNCMKQQQANREEHRVS